jgi:HSP20 family protein
MSNGKDKKTTDITPASPGTSLDKSIGPVRLARDFDSIFDEFRRSFDHLMMPYFPFALHFESPETFPVRYAPLDLIDNGDHYMLHVELPGFTKENVNVQINKDSLTIKAEKKQETEKKNKNYLHRERAYSAFQRGVAFPQEVDPQKAEGSMKDGVLELKIPKREPKPEEKIHRIPIT